MDLAAAATEPTKGEIKNKYGVETNTDTQIENKKKNKKNIRK